MYLPIRVFGLVVVGLALIGVGVAGAQEWEHPCTKSPLSSQNDDRTTMSEQVDIKLPPVAGQVQRYLVLNTRDFTPSPYDTDCSMLQIHLSLEGAKLTEAQAATLDTVLNGFMFTQANAAWAQVEEFIPGPYMNFVGRIIQLNSEYIVGIFQHAPWDDSTTTSVLFFTGSDTPGYKIIWTRPLPLDGAKVRVVGDKVSDGVKTLVLAPVTQEPMGENALMEFEWIEWLPEPTPGNVFQPTPVPSSTAETTQEN